MDRFKNLPDDVKSKILTRLPMKDAVRTSVLSRYWENKWISIDNIDVDDYASYASSFADFMYKLLLTSKLRIQRFSLVCYQRHDEYQLRTWISTVLKRGVQILDIKAHKCYEVCLLPVSLISSTSLKVLSLSLSSTLQVPPTQDNCFQNLKTLFLCNILMKNYNIQSPNNTSPRPLLLSFPVLKDLELRKCTWSPNVNMVEIRAPALVHFKVHNRSYEIINCPIKICAPKLERFVSYDGILVEFDLSCAPMVSYLGLKHTEPNGVHGSRSYAILSSFSLLSYMTITGEILKAFLEFTKHVRTCTKTHLSFGCLQKLHVISKVEVSELLKFLQLAPILEVLILAGSCHYDLPMEIPPMCVVSSLKKIVFTTFVGIKGEIDLLEWFLDKARELEKICIQDCTGNPMMRNQVTSLQLNTSSCVLVEFCTFNYKHRYPRWKLGSSPSPR